MAEVAAPEGSAASDRVAIDGRFGAFCACLCSSDVPSGSCGADFFRSLRLAMLSSEGAASLDGGVSGTEIDQAVTLMGGGGAPGPDGFPIEFYGEFSGRLSPLLCGVCAEALRLGCLPPTVSRAVVSVLLEGGGDPALCGSCGPGLLRQQNSSWGPCSAVGGLSCTGLSIPIGQVLWGGGGSPLAVSAVSAASSALVQRPRLGWWSPWMPAGRLTALSLTIYLRHLMGLASVRASSPGWGSCARLLGRRFMQTAMFRNLSPCREARGGGVPCRLSCLAWRLGLWRFRLGAGRILRALGGEVLRMNCLCAGNLLLCCSGPFLSVPVALDMVGSFGSVSGCRVGLTRSVLFPVDLGASELSFAQLPFGVAGRLFCVSRRVCGGRLHRIVWNESGAGPWWGRGGSRAMGVSPHLSGG